MKRVWKWGFFGIIVFTVIGIIGVGAGIWFIRRPWSQVKGTISVSGLLAPVEVMRDRWGVPHIYAQNEHDLFFAQGYVHAQDRLWQMEFNRRVSNATLSAVLGESTLEIDRFLRTLGLRRAAQKDWEVLDNQARSILEAYAKGVNAYIETHRTQLPLEFTILRVDPAPWTPLDTLAWGKLMSYDLGDNYTRELLRARMIASLGQDAAQQLFPTSPESLQMNIPAEVRQYMGIAELRADTFIARGALLGDLGPDSGSNNWVVHGQRTATGMPILCNDMHLGLEMPSIWYENSLHGGRFNSVGFSFPGVPLVITGHNDRIAWGIAYSVPDVQDLYIEKLDNPDKPKKYKFRGEWHDVQVVREIIDVKDQSPITHEVFLTHHGPIINAVVEQLQEGDPIAFQWTAFNSSYLFESLELLNCAKNWDEFVQALSYWDMPGQNFVYADIDGNIGYQMTGKIPIRAEGHHGLTPMPGWTGDYEWQGFIPYNELPRELNPAASFVATANNNVLAGNDSYPYHLTYEGCAPYRIQRITDLLAADDRVTIEAMKALQAHTYSLPAELLRPYLLMIDAENDLQAKILTQVKAWDVYNEVDRIGAAIYQTWYWFLVQNTLRDELGDELLKIYLQYSSIHAPMMIALMTQPNSPWFDDTSTSDIEDRDDIMYRSLVDAIAWLQEHYGDDPAQWKWGRLHTMTFVHQPFGQSGIRPLERLFNSKPVPVRGDNFTVNAASFSFRDPFEMVHGVSQRQIIDLSDFDNSLAIHTTGQSGQLFHPHREDFISMWQNIEYHPMLFSRKAVETETEAVLELVPQ